MAATVSQNIRVRFTTLERNGLELRIMRSTDSYQTNKEFCWEAESKEITYKPNGYTPTRFPIERLKEALKKGVYSWDDDGIPQSLILREGSIEHHKSYSHELFVAAIDTGDMRKLLEKAI